MSSALACRCREGYLSEKDRDRSLEALGSDLSRLFVVELLPALMSRARELLVHHPLRAGDAIQLAAGLHLRERLGLPVEFIAYDKQLNLAARDEGLEVIVS